MKILSSIAVLWVFFQMNPVFAAEQIQSADGKVSIETVSSSGETDLTSLEQALSNEADKKGASYYRVTSAGGNNMMSGTAEIYK